MIGRCKHRLEFSDQPFFLLLIIAVSLVRSPTRPTKDCLYNESVVEDP